MEGRDGGAISRRALLRAAGVGVAGLSLLPRHLLGDTNRVADGAGPLGTPPQERHFPSPEQEGSWRVGRPDDLGMDAARLSDAVDYHDTNRVTTSHGGALLIVHSGHVVSETYVTGTEGGPQPWTARSCNDMKSSTKSVFGTAVCVFLDEHRVRVDLDTYLLGASREDSLIPQL